MEKSITNETTAYNNIVEQVREKDLPELMNLLVTNFKSNVTIESLREFLRTKDKGCYCLGYFSEDKLIGTVTIYCHTLPTSRQATLWCLAVDENYRGRGIATKLMDAAEALAKSENSTKIWLFSGMSRLPAHNLYKKRGYDGERDKAFVKVLK